MFSTLRIIIIILVRTATVDQVQVNSASGAVGGSINSSLRNRVAGAADGLPVGCGSRIMR